VSQSKNPIEARRRVWRITQAAPLGEIVEVTTVAPSAPPLSEAPTEPASASQEGRESCWRASSMDLMHGLEISEEPDTIPGDLFDALFKNP
jgi:hypothetical protein